MVQPSPRSKLWRAITSPFRFGYDGAEDKGKRQAPRHGKTDEDTVLDKTKRDRLTGTAKDVQRNFAIAAWMIRRHLDYVSSFSFQAKTGDEDFDTEIEAFVADWSRRQRCDSAQRHPLRRLIRLAEARRVVDGDVGFLKIQTGQLQAIEGDRVRSPERNVPDNWDRKEWTHGVRTDDAGAAIEYAICDRVNGSFELSRVVASQSMFWHGFYDRFDQVRGISPLAAALNTLQDVYEGFDYALAKAKVAQLFGLVFYRDGEQGFGDVARTDSDGDGQADSGYEVDFGRGPVKLDLDPGDRAEFLESKSPPMEFQQFTQTMVMVCMKALDLPYSFFDEAHTNFYGSRGGLIQYLKSCKTKQEDVRELLDAITKWRLGLAVFNGEIVLPRGLNFASIMWEWVPDGVPWWDPVKEVNGNVLAIGAALTTPQRACREAGSDFYENVDSIAAAQEYAAAKGVALSFVPVQEITINQGSEE